MGKTARVVDAVSFASRIPRPLVSLARGTPPPRPRTASVARTAMVASRSRGASSRNPSARWRLAARALALLLALHGANGNTDAPEASGGTYVDATETITTRAEDRFGRQPTHRSGQTLVRDPPRRRANPADAADPPRPPSLVARLARPRGRRASRKKTATYRFVRDDFFTRDAPD